jgi:hypothetical protein
MTVQIRVELTMEAKEWEAEEFMNDVADNVSAKHHWSMGVWGHPRETERITFDAFFEVHNTYQFLKAALTEEQFRNGLLHGLEHTVKDLGVEIESVEVR